MHANLITLVIDLLAAHNLYLPTDWVRDPSKYKPTVTNYEAVDLDLAERVVEILRAAGLQASQCEQDCDQGFPTHMSWIFVSA